MQVSAIFSDGYKLYRHFEVINECPETSAFTSFPKNEQKEDESIYDLINEWKSFCHKQIEENNLDYTI